jgi:hypothetical protein
MPCRTVHIPGHGLAIVCSRVSRPRVPRCSVCHVPQTLATLKLCDGVVEQRQGTCDAWVCVDHAVHVEPDSDYCPRHAGQAASTG